MRRIPALLLSFGLAGTLSACPPMASTSGGNAMSLALSAERDPAGKPGLQVRFRALALPTSWDRALFRLSSATNLPTPLEKTVAASDMAAAPDGSRVAAGLFPIVPAGTDYQLFVRLYDGDTPVAGAQMTGLMVGGIGTTLITATVTDLTTPVVSGFTPSTPLGRPGDTIHVLGSGFGTTTGTVSIHGVPLTVQNWTDTDITAVLPANATSGLVVVTTANGSPSTGTLFAIRRDQLFLLGATAGVQSLTMNGFTTVSGYPAQTGSAPGRMAFDAGRNRLYGLLEGSKQLAVLNAQTLDPVAGSPLNLDGAPSGVAYDPTSDRIFVSCTNTNKLTVFNAQTLTPVAGSPLGTASTPTVVAANAGKVYWLNQGAGTVSAINAQTLQALASPVSAGISPSGLAIDPGRHRIGVVSMVNQTLTLFNADTLASITSGTTGPAPMELVYDPTTDKYVANTFNGNGIEVFDPVSAAKTSSRIVDSGPVAMGLDPVHSRLLIAHALADKVTGIDLQNLSIVGGGAISVGRTPKAITYDPTQDLFWVANQASQQWAQLGRSALNQLPPVSVGVTADMAAYDSGRNRLYVPQREGRVLEAVDAGTGLILRTLHQTLGTSPGPIAYDSVHDRIFVANRGPGTVSVVNAETFAPVSGSPLTVGANPIQLRYDPQKDRIYVLSMDTRKINIFKASDLTPVSNTITTGLQPIDLIVAPDGNRFFVLCKGSNLIENWDANAFSRTAEYMLGGTPVAMALDPVRSRLYALVPSTGLIGMSAGNGQALGGSPWTMGANVMQLLFDPIKDQLYGLDATNQRLEVRNGNTLAPVSGSPFATGLSSTSMLMAQ